MKNINFNIKRLVTAIVIISIIATAISSAFIFAKIERKNYDKYIQSNEMANEERQIGYSISNVMVSIKPDYTNSLKIYFPSFYNKDLVKYVDVSIRPTENNNMMLIMLYLKEPSKENVDELCESLKDNPALKYVEKTISQL